MWSVCSPIAPSACVLLGATESYALILNPAPTLTIGYHALSLLNLHGLLWIGIVFTFLRFERDVTPARALLVPLAGWTTISLAQLGFHAFTAQILG